MKRRFLIRSPPVSQFPIGETRTTTTAGRIHTTRVSQVTSSLSLNASFARSFEIQRVEFGALWSTWARVDFLLPLLWPSRTSDGGSNLLRRRLILILILLIARRPTLILRFKAHIFFFLSLPLFPSATSVSDLRQDLKLSRSERVQAG